MLILVIFKMNLNYYKNIFVQLQKIVNMSRVLEKSFGGLLNSLIGSGSLLGNASLEALTTGTQDINFVSQGLISFVERLEAARKISKQVCNYK